MTVDPSYVEMAKQAVALLGPYLVWMAGKAAEGTAEKAGQQLFEWLKSRFSAGTSKAVLDDAVAEPNEDNLEGLAIQIRKLLRADEQAPGELAELFKAASVKTGDVTANVHGKGNVVVQSVGRNIKANISK